MVNDRRVWVPGTLAQDHPRWNISFRVPSGVEAGRLRVHLEDAKPGAEMELLRLYR